MPQMPTIAIVGGESLIGREVREVLQEQKFPARVQLIGVDQDVFTLTEQDGEAAIIPPLDEASLTGAQIAFLAGSADSSRRALALIARSPARPAIIDLTYLTEDEPSARLRAPLVEESEPELPPQAIHVVAHPAASALALLLLRLDENFPVRRCLAHIFEPASERGHRGLEELRQQTVSLLSFQPLPKSVYDAQLGFNLLASFGSEAPETLLSIELRIEKHLASLLSARGVSWMPSLRLVQVPVFHGYSISAYVEFGSPPDLAALSSALASAQVDVRTGQAEPPDSAGFAGQSGIAVGSIAADRNNPSAVWFWVVADNLRLMADEAVAVARALLRRAGAGDPA
jgi:aspartate-semialdehyde dehydrogenase